MKIEKRDAVLNIRIPNRIKEIYIQKAKENKKTLSDEVNKILEYEHKD